MDVQVTSNILMCVCALKMAALEARVTSRFNYSMGSMWGCPQSLFGKFQLAQNRADVHTMVITSLQF